MQYIRVKHMVKVKHEDIKIFLPLIKQKFNYTCGVAVLQSILVYYNLYNDIQDVLIKKLEADTIIGTEPYNIIKFAKKQGLKVKEYQEMTIDQLKSQLNKKHPVICLIQAWGNPDTYEKGYHGHYVIAIGYNDKHFYFVDPVLEGVLGVLSIEQFEKRWYFSDGKDHLNKYGIAIWKPRFHYCHRANFIN